MGGSVERLAINDKLQIDLTKLIERAAQPAKLLIFANPMNPSGSWLNPEQLRQLFAAKHPETMLVLDEAYHEYAVHGNYTSGLDLTELIPGHWVVLRTFSKSWGLAGSVSALEYVVQQNFAKHWTERALPSIPIN